MSATLTNHTSNLTTVSNLLGTLCREIDDSSRLPLTDDDRARHEARGFLDELHDRIDQVDETMVVSTEYLLPTLSNGDEPSRMTVTELSQLIETLHVLTEKRAIQIDSCLHGSYRDGDEEIHPESSPNDQATQRYHENYHWSLGLPLDKVVETDNETDRYSLESNSVMSPAVSTTRSKQGVSTPCTPSVTELRLSASTASILTQKIIEFNSPVVMPPANSVRTPVTPTVQATDYSRRGGTPFGSFASCGFATRLEHLDNNSSDAQGEESSAEEQANQDGRVQANQFDDVSMSNFNAFLEENYSIDELTLCSTVVAEDPKTAKKGEGLGSRQTYVAAADESNLSSRLDATYKSYPSQEDLESESGPSEEEDDEEVESTLCPTVVAARREPTLRQPASQQRAVADLHFREQELSPDGQDKSMSRSYHVDVGDSLPSPAPTALTMDATMFLNDAEVLSQPSRTINDNTSNGEETQETPVLDRYRIDADDSSVGFKVVPNERGPRRKKARAKNANSSPRAVVSHDQAATSASQVLGKNDVPKTVKFSNTSQTISTAHDHMMSPPNYERQVLDYDNRFATSTRTPQAEPKICRKTPCRKEATESLQSQFDPAGDHFNSFQSPTPNSTKKVYRQTPFARQGREKGSVPDAAQAHRKTPLRDAALSPGHANKENNSRVKFRTEAQLVETAARYSSSRETRPSSRVHFETSRSPFMYLPMNAKSPHKTQFAHVELMASPVSLASTLTGCTGMMQIENFKELFPAQEPIMNDDSPAHDRFSAFSNPRKSSSAAISVVSEVEWDEASPVVKVQFSLNEVNQAVRALNGAVFLRKVDVDDAVQFTDAEAYRILRNCGFKRRRCKGLLMSLCHWGRLSMRFSHTSDESDSAQPSTLYVVAKP